MNQKTTNQMVSNRQKKKRLIVRAFVMTLFMALFTQFAQAQDVYMHTGSRTVVGNDVVKFYDSGGKSSGPAYYWERWFMRNEDYTFTFKPGEDGKKIKVTFKQFTAYTDNDGAQAAHAFIDHPQWALRINTAELSFYDGLTTDAENLITTYTGGVINEFSVIADGPMTIHFQSYGYREEGWEAEVQQVDDYTPQAPSISFQACSDDIIINPNNKGATLYYTIDGNAPVVADPLTGATLYEGPFHVAGGTPIKAIAVVDGVSSDVAAITFTRGDVTPTPGEPTMTRDGNTIIMTPAAIEGDLNETYEVWYKTEEDGIYVKYTQPIEWSTPGTTFYAITRAKTCSDKESSYVTLLFDKVQVPDPTITFTVTNQNSGEGTVTISCPAGYVLSYTVDGSTPLPAGGTTNSVSLTNVAPGTTIKAIAYKSDGSGGQDTDYKESNIITMMCLPGGEGSGGVYNGGDGGGVVILDDRESHSWSYYSDSEQPIHSLKPADVKITYTGFGPNTMTTTDAADEPTLFDGNVTSDMVGVNYDAPANQFIYFKTLENADETGNGSTNLYPYTMIPNPFQKRPTYNPGKNYVDNGLDSNVTVKQTEGNRDEGNGISRNGYRELRSLKGNQETFVGRGNQGTTDVTYEKVTASQSDWSGTYLLVYDYSTTTGWALSGVTTDSIGSYTSLTVSSGSISSIGSAKALTIAPYASGSQYYTIQIDGQYLGSGTYGMYTTSTLSTQCQWSISYTSSGISIYCPYWSNDSNYPYYLKFFNYSSNYRYFTEISASSNYYSYSYFPSLYKETNTGGGSDTCYDFESGTTGWTFANGSTNYWTRGTAASHGGNYGLYITNGNTNNTYGYNNYTTGTADCSYAYFTANLTANTPYTLSYDWRAYGEVSSYYSTIYDYMRVVLVPNSVTLTGGTLYSNLTYNGVPNGWQALDGGALYNTSSWGSKNQDFTVTTGGTYKIVFVWRNDSSSGTQPPAAIDNVCLEGGTPTYTVTYNANGGSGTMTDPNSPYEPESTVTVLANSFTAPQYKVFSGWNTAANGSGTSYAAGDTFTITGNTTLYAQWVDDGVTRYNVHVATVTNGTLTANPTTNVEVGTTVTVTATPAYGYTLGTITVTNETTNQAVTVNISGNTGTFSMPAANVTVYATFYDPSATYRGFYAWRVKKLSNGLGIQDKASKAPYGVGGIIFADQEIEFVTDNAEGNEVEFEALWAQAYVTTTTSTSGLNANVGYERNFMVLGSTPSPQTGNVTIGSNSSTTYGSYFPLNSSYYYYSYDDQTWYYSTQPYSLSEQIYLASEIGEAGRLNSIDFYVNNVNSYVGNTTRNVVVYLKHTSLSEFRYAPGTDGTTYYYWMEGVEASDKVFTGTVDFSSTGWKTITFDTPFDYDGINNLAVCVVDNTGTYIQNNNYNSGNNYNLYFSTYSTGANRALAFRRTTSYVDWLEAGNYSGSRNVRSYCNYVRFNKTTTLHGNELSGFTVPCTVMACKPDGTDYSSTVKVSGSINSGADLKLENILVEGSATSAITANGHDFIAGRGITGNLATGHIRGMADGSTAAVKYTIRLESGTYGQFDMIDDEIHEFGNTVSTRAIFGSDYDRAKPDNDKLSVAPEGTVYGGNASHVFNGQDNRNNITYDWIIKSGKVQGVQDLADAEAERSIYMGNSIAANDNDALKYCGKRRLTMEGGEIASIAGGVNCYGDNYTTYAVNDNTWSVLVRIKGGTVRGSVYGAAAFAGASGDRRFVMTGGTVNGWIAGGCNGTHNDGGELYGIANIYVGGKTQVSPSSDDPYIGGTSSYGTNGAYGGYIFGAGCGIAPVGFDETTANPNWSLLETNTVGKVFGSRIVVADECEVGRDIYGGGNFGFVAGDSGDMGLTGNTDKKAEIYILGGTVHGDVQGGSNNSIGQTVNIYVRGGEIIGRDSENPQYPSDDLEGSVYGGSDTWGVINGPATIEITGGHLKGSVFGGGYGPETDMAGGTFVNVKGGTIDQNVYGGGEMGTVSNGDTHVTVSGGTMKDVFGAGKGDKDSSEAAQVTGQTFVTVTGGTMANVYGGGEAGDVVNGTNLASTVTVNGATVSGDVFGGGKLGNTTGNTQVNIQSGNVRGSVFGGALGEAGKIFVAGKHTVNIMGGRVFGSVYGGSRNANDALAFTGYDTNEKGTNAVVNISAGQVDQQVYAAGYYGKTFGSVYAFIGKEAILNAPHHDPSFGNDNEQYYKAANLRLANNVWAGGDWGVFTSGSFGAPTVSGYSNIYVNGYGYNTETMSENDATYMNIGGSLFGCGTSCDAGKAGRTIMVSNYGAALGGSKNDNFPEPYSEATRTLYSIQRADSLILDNAHLNLTGHAQINSLDATAKYSIYSFDKTVRLANGSSLFLNAVATQIKDFWNASCADVYATNASYTPVAYNKVSETPNKIRVNGGNFIEIYHDKMINDTDPGYGMLNGFAYMMVADDSADNTCAYARPKQCDETPIDEGLDNPTDGGWVSYDVEKNTFDIDGHTVSAGSSDQMPYENHKNATKNGEQYFRIWRCGGAYSEREAVFNVKVDGTDSFGYVDVSVNLPAWRDADSYYAFQVTEDGNNTTIDYGSDVMMFNAAMTGDGAWVYFDEHGEAQVAGENTTAQNKIKENPNVNFGLVTMAGTAMAGTPLIVCNESDHFLADTASNHFTCGDFEKNPFVTFRLTYHNSISTNMTWDPMYITLVQLDKSGAVKDIVKIICIINTYTSIDQTFTTQTYAIMNGLGSPNDEYVAKVVLPTFDIFDPTAEHESQFKLTSVTFEPESGNDATQGSWVTRGSSYDLSHFAMEIGASLNEDNTDAWNGSSTGMWDSKTYSGGTVLLGETGGREPFAFDFRLTYNGREEFDPTEHNNRPRLGMLTFTITFDNVKLPQLDANDQPMYDQETGEQLFYSGTKTLIVKVDVIRRGIGRAFYIDGQYGSNANDAQHPDQAVLSLSTIFNRCGYLPGDVIYIVNAVDVDKELEWSGTRYDNVHIYRYPGGHDLSKTQKKNANGEPLYYDENNQETTTVTDNPVWIIGVIEDNEDNEAYLGTLINVQGKGDMIIRDITLDGHKLANGSDAAVAADEPMIDIASGGILTLTTGTTLQYNSSKADGGAVAVNDGGTLKMNANATLFKNETGGEGGGVYMVGTMIVSDSIQIDSNYLAGGKVFNNVYLYSNDDNQVYDKVIQIGTTADDDAFGPLTSAARIGVTKDLTADVDGYTRVLYVENSNDIPWLDVPFESTPNAVVFHDGRMYQLVQYTDPQYLYWIGTWVTVQYWNPHYASDTVTGYDANNFSEELSNIDTPEKLAWLISYVNGLNGASAHQNVTATITNEIDMDESIWVPIGTKDKPFTGTFNGNGYTVEGIRSPLVNTSMGMFGYTEGATIQNVVAEVAFDGDAINKGSVVGTMKGGNMANVEAAGLLTGKANTVNLGGLVGESSNSAKIHSSFAVNTMNAELATTNVGGLVGTNGGDLYNSYSNVTFAEGMTNTSGLVGVNTGTVENCYNASAATYAFAYKNQIEVENEGQTTLTKGIINLCYAGPDVTTYVGSEAPGTLTGHGNYSAPLDRKALGYMYNDNKVTVVSGQTNSYVVSAVSYAGGKIDKWPGMLSSLNQWVKANPAGLTKPTSWLRPITTDINGDLPVLCFPSDSCLATIDGKFLDYSANLDTLLNEYNTQSAATQIFLYKNAVNVESVPANNVNVFINEDAVLLQKQGDGRDNTPNFINTIVGISFDNSCGHADDYFGNTLAYDWHLLSTPLADAPLGITYNESVDQNWWEDQDSGQVTGVSHSYMPDDINAQSDVKWDFYTYYEPQYHWINFKRNSASHNHYEAPHDPIDYTNETTLVPGRGYMMAISTDSYMSNDGTLNNGPVSIPLTVSGELPESETPSKDWGSNLVGNPYQAYLDLDEVTAKTDQSEFYIYDADNGVYGPYMTGASINTAIPSKYIHPHQAFFVVTDKTKNNEGFAFTYDMATTNKNTASYYRGEEQPKYPLVNLFAENENGNRDLAVIEFNRPELNGVRKVNNLRNANFKISAHLGRQGYSLVFVPEGTEKVPVHFKTTEDGTFTLRWQTMHGTFTSLILVDNLTGTHTDMLRNDHYTFNGSVDDYAARFYITYNVTDVDELNGNGEQFAWYDGNDWIVTGNGVLQVVDVTGRVLTSSRVSGQTRIHLNGYAAGVYMLRMSGNNTVKTQKIVVK